MFQSQKQLIIKIEYFFKQLSNHLNFSSHSAISYKDYLTPMMLDDYQEIKPGTTIQNYYVLNKIGNGRYGVVYHCINKTNNQPVAIKQSQLNLQLQGVSAITLREISVLYQLKSQNVVNLISNFMGPNCMFLVFQLLETDLQRCLTKEEYKCMDPAKIKQFLFQILKAIDFCHTRRVIHRDLKPGNIFLTKQGKLKLGDFGLSRTFTYPYRPLTQEVVTLWYRAPEILLGNSLYGPPIDIWSIGCIFGEMIFGKVMFQGYSQMDQLDKIFEIMGTPSLEYWPQLLQMKNYDVNAKKYNNDIFREGVYNCDLEESGKELLYALLELNPRNRITAHEALKHPYFKDMYK